MTVVRNLVLGLLVAGAVTWVALSALAQDKPEFPGYAGDAFGPDRIQYTQSTPYQFVQSESTGLAQQHVKADKEDQKKEIRKKLADALSQQFDVHIKKQQKELEDLEKQVGKLREVLKKRVDAKATIVERRVEQLVQEAEGLGWSAPSSRPRTFVSPQLDTAATLPGQRK
jgi:hypothetical protein